MEEIKMITPEGENVNIDAAIAPIIQMLWTKGLKTIYCCAGHIDYENPDRYFQTYITFDLCHSAHIYSAMNSLLFDAENYPEYLKFIQQHFNIAIDVFQKQITIEAMGSTVKTWNKIIQTFYDFANCARTNSKCDLGRSYGWWIGSAKKCITLNGVDAPYYSGDSDVIFPHINFNFFVFDDDNEEIYVSFDRQYVYSTWYDLELENDDVVRHRPMICDTHEQKMSVKFIQALSSHVLEWDEFISMFGLDKSTSFRSAE